MPRLGEGVGVGQGWALGSRWSCMLSEGWPFEKLLSEWLSPHQACCVPGHVPAPSQAWHKVDAPYMCAKDAFIASQPTYLQEENVIEFLLRVIVVAELSSDGESLLAGLSVLQVVGPEHHLH